MQGETHTHTRTHTQREARRRGEHMARSITFRNWGRRKFWCRDKFKCNRVALAGCMTRPAVIQCHTHTDTYAARVKGHTAPLHTFEGSHPHVHTPLRRQARPWAHFSATCLLFVILTSFNLLLLLLLLCLFLLLLLFCLLFAQLNECRALVQHFPLPLLLLPFSFQLFPCCCLIFVFLRCLHVSKENEFPLAFPRLCCAFRKIRYEASQANCLFFPPSPLLPVTYLCLFLSISVTLSVCMWCMWSNFLRKRAKLLQVFKWPATRCQLQVLRVI